jgi:hypothetical protein
VLQHAPTRKSVACFGAVNLATVAFVRMFCDIFNAQLASIERVWKLARRLAKHNRYFATLAELLEVVNLCFDAWRRPNPRPRRLCCIRCVL